ncbi:hypothetical protein K2173_024613 [Erythroxylum novogranatense]|uniref:Glycosyl transferase family 1 domain-containing protein n=1 Tax=Erythroxylum novogranatense TaxID=1862640 RepID=A0AAV8SUS7_9ROSI|nr:hypothetical protein K2173_024613 [Erythroxylum novogranatense]
MEDIIGRGDLHVNVVRQSPLRPAGSLKSTLSGRSTPRSSPTFRRSHSNRTPRREGRSGGGGLQCFRINRIVYWLLLITLWTYLAFYVQSRWAHGYDKGEFLGFLRKNRSTVSEGELNTRRDLLADKRPASGLSGIHKIEVEDSKNIDVILSKKGSEVSSKRDTTTRKKNKRSRHRSRSKTHVKQKARVEVESNDVEVQEPDIPQKNSSYGLLVGPFGSVEDRLLGWSPERRSGTCDRKGNFARFVWSRNFVLVFHEMSLTGAPLSMLELATELLSCGARVSAVVLSKKGGLMSELARRRIKVLEDRAELSFKTAMKADLVIAGSAVCASWIDQYIDHFPAGASQIAWWIMENRREYFDRSKVVIDRVKMVVFLSETQAKQWLTWCEQENIKLRSSPAIVELSVNDELAFVAGIACSLNTPSSPPDVMLEKRRLLRDSVRKEMGLQDTDMLVISLSSVNPGKGQLLLLESANLVFNHEHSRQMRSSVSSSEDKATLAAKHHLRSLLLDSSNSGKFSNELGVSNEFIRLDEPKKQGLIHGRKTMSSEGAQKQDLKILIGSVGSKSNKLFYVKEMLNFLNKNQNLSKSVMWTLATTRVASLYSAADVYVINSQGVGETFGRVTIEAMAFGLPVLGTNSGGTKELVDHNVTGLLHPVGRPGSRVLAENLQFLLENPSVRLQMGMEGRRKVEKMYLKRHMYKKFAEVVYKCLRPK